MSADRSCNWSKYEKLEPEKVKVPVTFFSKVGKKRLQNIWTDQELDQENFYASCIEYGPSATLTQEKVSDYVHTYLQLKNKTILAMHHFYTARFRAVESCEEFFEKFGWHQKEPPQYYFQIFAGASQAVYDNILKERMAARRQLELVRTKKLIIERQLDPPPKFKHPLLTVNILNGKLAALQEIAKTNKKLMRFGELPKIKFFDGSKLFRKTKKDKTTQENVLMANASQNKEITTNSMEPYPYSLDLKTPNEEGSKDLCDFSDSVFEF